MTEMDSCWCGWIQGANDFSRNSSRHHVWRDGCGYHAAGADDATGSDRNPLQNGHVQSQPNVILDGDGAGWSPPGVFRMPVVVGDYGVGPASHPVSQRDPSFTSDNGAAESTPVTNDNCGIVSECGENAGVIDADIVVLAPRIQRALVAETDYGAGHPAELGEAAEAARFSKHDPPDSCETPSRDRGEKGVRSIEQACAKMWQHVADGTMP